MPSFGLFPLFRRHASSAPVVHSLHRIMHRFLHRLLRPAPRRSCEVYFHCLQVVLFRNLRAVAKPTGHNVDGELFYQLRFSRTAKVLERLGPRLQTGASNDPVPLRLKVLRRVSVSGDNVLASFLGLLECVQQKRVEFGKDGNHARRLPLMFRFRAANGETHIVEVHVRPLQRQYLPWDGYDLSTSTEFPICTDAAEKGSPDISGTTVVWYDYRNGNNPDIYGANIPEPATLSLLAIGGLAMLRRRRK